MYLLYNKRNNIVNLSSAVLIDFHFAIIYLCYVRAIRIYNPKPKYICLFILIIYYEIGKLKLYININSWKIGNRYLFV